MLALLFPGLVPNKHKSTYRWLESDSYAVSLVKAAEKHLGPDLLKRHVDAEIYDWNVYQAVYLIESLSLARAWCQMNSVNPDVLAGQSFGSIAAAVYANSIPFDDMIQVIMDSTATEIDYFSKLGSPLACVFFFRCPIAAVYDIIRDVAASSGADWVDVSVIQERGVMAVSGTRGGIAEFSARVKDAGGIIFYTIDRAEHCPSLTPLAARLREEAYKEDRFDAPSNLLMADNGVVLRSGVQVARDLAEGWGRRLINREQYESLESIGVNHIVIPGHSALFAKDSEIGCETTLVRAREFC